MRTERWSIVVTVCYASKVMESLKVTFALGTSGDRPCAAAGTKVLVARWVGARCTIYHVAVYADLGNVKIVVIVHMGHDTVYRLSISSRPNAPAKLRRACAAATPPRASRAPSASAGC